MAEQIKNNKTWLFSLGSLLNLIALIAGRQNVIPDWTAIILQIIACSMLIGYIISVRRELKFKDKE